MRPLVIVLGLLLALTAPTTASGAEGDTYTVSGPESVTVGDTYTHTLTVVAPDGTPVAGETIRADRSVEGGTSSVAYDLVTDGAGQASVTATLDEAGTETISWYRVDGETATLVAESRVGSTACRCSPPLPEVVGRDLGPHRDGVVVRGLTAGAQVVVRRTRPDDGVVRRRTATSDRIRLRVRDVNDDRGSSYVVVVREGDSPVTRQVLQIR